eukprot:6395030-Prymnesium_polylepis.2
MSPCAPSINETVRGGSKHAHAHARSEPSDMKALTNPPVSGAHSTCSASETIADASGVCISRAPCWPARFPPRAGPWPTLLFFL